MKRVVVTASGPTPGDDDDVGGVLEKTPEAILKALKDLQGRGKLALMSDGQQAGEVGNFQLAIVAEAPDEVPSGSISMHYEAEESDGGDRVLQHELDIADLYYTPTPRNPHAAVRADSDPAGAGEQDPAPEGDADNADNAAAMAELAKLREENTKLWEDKAKALLPEKPSPELVKALEGKTPQEKYEFLAVVKSLAMPTPQTKPPAKPGGVPVPTGGSGTGGHTDKQVKPPAVLTYGGERRQQQRT